MGKYNTKLKTKRIGIYILIVCLGISFCFSSYKYFIDKKKAEVIDTSIVSNLALNASEDMFLKELQTIKTTNEDVLGIIEIPNTEFRRFL